MTLNHEATIIPTAEQERPATTPALPPPPTRGPRRCRLEDSPAHPTT
jgi:hypothetical protein